MRVLIWYISDVEMKDAQETSAVDASVAEVGAAVGEASAAVQNKAQQAPGGASKKKKKGKR